MISMTLRRVLFPSLLATGLLGLADAGATISGVCPDGSMFIVQRAEDVPCAKAKRVAPSEMPPIKPEFLPRPYAWEVFNERQDPNNPYNLVDSARQVREAAEPPDAPPLEAPTPRESAAVQAPSPAPVSAAPPPVELALSPDERRDLALIVELSQQRVPAGFEPSDGAPPVVLRLAHSRAFEARLQQSWAARGRPLRGPVVLFTAEAAAPASFYANLTFAQGHTAFHPDTRDPSEFELVEGSLGALPAGERVLGYVVLPESLDLSRPLDVYWNDRRLVATLRP